MSAIPVLLRCGEVIKFCDKSTKLDSEPNYYAILIRRTILVTNVIG